MIAGIFHEGSGLGNQLHRYVMTRVLALDKGFEFGMVNPRNFKGASFLNLDMGKTVFLDREYALFNEKKVVNKDDNDIRPYDWDGINHVKDNTIIDGEFQGEKYYEHHLSEIKDWLRTTIRFMPKDLCVIGFRGGEYRGVRDLFLPKRYWDDAIMKMKKINPNMKFEVHTDDVETAEMFFPSFECMHDMELNWQSVRYAEYLIIANSSFYILPSLLNENVKKIIAPKYWAGHNKGYWQLEQNKYKKFSYI